MLWLAAYLTGFPPVGLHALRWTHGLAPMWSGLYLISTGVYRDDITTIEEAIDMYKSIDPERMHGIPSIGIRCHTEGDESWQDEQIDVVTGENIDLGYIQFVSPELCRDERVQEAIKKLIAAFPDKEVVSEL